MVPTSYWFEPPVAVGHTLYRHFHTGIDIADPWGATVSAAASGRVE